MKILDTEIMALDLTDPMGLVKLIVQYFCAKPVPILNDSELQLVQHFVSSARKSGLNFEQLNELLFVLRQNRVSEAFFEFFFAAEANTRDAQTRHAALSIDDLRRGVIRFRALAMLRYGNFTFARRTLSRMDDKNRIAD